MYIFPKPHRKRHTSPNAGLMLGHRLRRWPIITPALYPRLLCTAGCYQHSECAWEGIFRIPVV